MSERKTFCTFRLEGHWFVIEVESVQEVLRHQPVTALGWANESVRGLLNLRGQVVAAVDLRRGLGMAPRPSEQLASNVVVRIGGAAVSLWVDEVGDVAEVDTAAFERTPSTLAGVSQYLIRGVYKLEDHLLLALDLPRVINAVMT